MYNDSHVHTSFSGDSGTPAREQIRRALSLGMSSLCITDHQDFDFPGGEEFTFDTEGYFAELSSLKEEYRGRLDLRIGAELGLQPRISTDLAAYVSSFPFDYIIGSTHVCKGRDPYYPDFYEGREQEDAYLDYFEEELANLKAYDCFDAAGHLDYVVRYGPRKNDGYSYSRYRELFDEMLKTLIEKGKALECNTGGLRAGLGHPHPTEEILRRYRELGGQLVTLGSDAHDPASLGYAFDSLGALLKQCGFRYYAVYKDRKPQLYPL